MSKSWLTKRGKYYYVYWYDENGRLKKRSTRAVDKETAYRRKQEIDEERSLRERSPLNIAVMDYIEVLQQSSTFSAAHLENVKAQLRFFVDWYGRPNTPITEIKKSDIARFREHLSVKRKIRNVTANRYLSSLRGLFTWAVEIGLAVSNVVDSVSRLKDDTGRRKRVVTDRELTAILQEAATSLHLKLAVCLIRFAGMRNGEVWNLQWQDIDDEEKNIRIVHNPPERRTKTAKSRRTILTLEILTALCEWHKIAPKSKWVFVNSDGSRMRYETKRLNRLIRRSGVEGVTAYNLRHTFITRMIEAGHNPVAVMFAAGHNKLSTTDVYTHLSAELMIDTLKTGKTSESYQKKLPMTF